MFIADRKVVIREKNVGITYSMLEKLDEMLTQYGLDHFLALPQNDPDGNPVEDAVVEVYYSCYDEVTVEIVIMLWAKITGARSDESIMSGVVKSWGKKLKACPTIEKTID